MKVISTNIAKPRTVSWRGREIQTGIYKEPIKEPIFLGNEDVRNDTVIDRKHHGGEHKACYLFGADYYDDWKQKYPKLDWNWGMFGENLTVEGLNENMLQIGAIYELGDALVQISEPRQPCYKLGIRFGTQKVIVDFLEYGHPGTYVRILKEGLVSKDDMLQLKKAAPNALTVAHYNTLVNQKGKDKELVRLAVTNTSIPQVKRDLFQKHL
jgi:MOSC domain-containing protein YiiM